MCGIAGLVDDGTPEEDIRAQLCALIRPLIGRGPDGDGAFADSGIGLAHSRLAIVDLSERGRQPLANEDETVWVVCNGEIYNHRELRRDLEGRGHVFRSGSDCEVLVHLYEEHSDAPEQVPKQLRGMFAFALWDVRRRRLLLGRDRLGIKPLFYHEHDGLLVFGSTVDAVVGHRNVPAQLDWTSIYEYLLLLSVPGPSTVYQGVRHLPPGSLLVREGGHSRLLTYWRVEDCAQGRIGDEKEAVQKLEAALSDSATVHLEADVEVGAFLSGGLDSGLVTAFAQAGAGFPLQSFCATFPGEPVDEGPWAAETASRLGTRHSTLPVRSGFLDGLDEAVAAMDQPLALTSALSLFHLSRLARQHVKVVLTGDGGDELFAGYRRHRPYLPSAQVLRSLPIWSWRPLARTVDALIPSRLAAHAPLLSKARNAFGALLRDEALSYVPRLYVQEPDTALGMLPHDARPGVDRDRYRDRIRAILTRMPSSDSVTRMLLLDLQTSLSDEMLTKVDRMTMAHALEARVPLLDPAVIEVALSWRNRTGQNETDTKRPLRCLAESRLGTNIASRPKSGFNSPLQRWLTSEPITQQQIRTRQRAATILDPSAWDSLIQGGPAAAGAVPLFAGLVLETWAKQRRVSAG